MKNTAETLANKKFYSTRISSCVERQFDFEGYVIRIKGYPAIFQAKRCFNPEKDKKVFIKGQGWKNVKSNNIEFVTVPKVETYSQVMELVQQYGYRCASQMIGFDLASYGDHYPISDVAKMETFGITYVEWLERIAELDYKILQYLNGLGISVTGKCYDMWLNQGDNDTYKCLFRDNPFLGYQIESSLFGMIPMTPNINPISFDEVLWQVISQFHSEYVHDVEDIEKFSELKGKFDNISVKGWVEIMCGKEDAEWMHKNLTFKSSPLTEMSNLDVSIGQLATLAHEVNSKEYKAMRKK